MWSDAHSAESYARDPLFRQRIDKTARTARTGDGWTAEVRMPKAIFPGAGLGPGRRGVLEETGHHMRQ